ncbi:unnamed protein product, partial [Didymodactylos carnosus]
MPLRPDTLMTCTALNEILNLHGNSIRLIDVRTLNEYIGKTTGYSYVKIAGRIKGAIYDQTDGIFGRISNQTAAYDNKTFIFPHSNYFQEKWLNIGLDSEVNSFSKLVFMCGTGWRASLAAIYAEYLGFKNVAVLDS